MKQRPTWYSSRHELLPTKVAAIERTTMSKSRHAVAKAFKRSASRDELPIASKRTSSRAVSDLSHGVQESASREPDLLAKPSDFPVVDDTAPILSVSNEAKRRPVYSGAFVHEGAWTLAFFCKAMLVSAFCRLSHISIVLQSSGRDWHTRLATCE